MNEEAKPTDLYIAHLDALCKAVRGVADGLADLKVIDSPPQVVDDARELIACLLRALGTREIFRAYNDGTMEPQWPLANREAIHDAFGAPGDWGYDHPIGMALSNLYRVPLASAVE